MERQATSSYLAVWWLNPAWTSLVMALLLVPLGVLVPESVYRTFWRTPKFCDLQTLVIGLVCAAAFAVGAFAGATPPHAPTIKTIDEWTSKLPKEFILRAFRWCFYLTLTGYLVWAGSAIYRGLSWRLALGILQGTKGAMETVKSQYMVTISGVTTLTQFGLIAAVLGALIGCAWGWSLVRGQLCVLFALTLVRVVLNSERLALMEVAIPFAVVALRLSVLDCPRSSILRRRLLSLAPVCAAAFVFVIFGGFEYLRSWTNYYAAGPHGFWEFAGARFLGYYVTGFNNAALMLQSVPPSGAPFFTFHLLWRLPFYPNIGATLFPDVLLNTKLLPVEANQTHSDALDALYDVRANLEFNTFEGHLAPVFDYGVAGALLYWIVAGLICGYLYRQFCRKQLLGLTLYPLLFTGIVELPRIIYWAEGRVIPSFGAAILITLLAARASAADTNSHSNPIPALTWAPLRTRLR